jgi:hypothetical protein
MNPNDGYQLVWTGTQGTNYAFVSPAQLPLINGCGRCAEFMRTLGTNTYRVTVTIVGECNATTCGNGVELSSAAYQILAPNGEPSLPLPGDSLMWRFVECPVPGAPDGQPERIRASVRTGTDVTMANGIRFLGQRYGIASVRTIINGTTVDLIRGTDNYWAAPNNAPLGPQIVQVTLSDTNNRQVTTSVLIQQNEQTTSVQFPVCP